MLTLRFMQVLTPRQNTQIGVVETEIVNENENKIEMKACCEDGDVENLRA